MRLLRSRFDDGETSRRGEGGRSGEDGCKGSIGERNERSSGGRDLASPRVNSIVLRQSPVSSRPFLLDSLSTLLRYKLCFSPRAPPRRFAVSGLPKGETPREASNQADSPCPRRSHLRLSVDPKPSTIEKTWPRPGHGVKGHALCIEKDSEPSALPVRPKGSLDRSTRFLLLSVIFPSFVVLRLLALLRKFAPPCIETRIFETNVSDKRSEIA